MNNETSSHHIIGRKPPAPKQTLHGVCKCGLVYEASVDAWDYWTTEPDGTARYTMECAACGSSVASIAGKYPDAERKRLVDASAETIATHNKTETPKTS